MSKPLRAIKHAFDSYVEHVVPVDASKTQLVETHRAFYAGASVVLDILKIISEPDISRARGMAVLDALHNEYAEFIDEMRNEAKGGPQPSMN